MSVTTVRCAKCDTVFDGEPYSAAIQTLGHPGCPNPACNPELAAKVAAQREKDAADLAEFREWQASRKV